MVSRRVSIATLLATTAMPGLLRAAEPPARRIGYLSPVAENDAQSRLRMEAFLRRLRELGWTDKQTIRIEARYAAGDLRAMQRYCRELVSASPDLLIVISNEALALVRDEKVTLPVLFISVSDPVGSGFVATLSRPGGNMTGFTNYDPSTGAKWLEVLRELAPHLGHVGVLLNDRIAANRALADGVEKAAAGKLSMARIHAHEAEEIDRGLAGLAERRNGGVIVMPNPTNGVHLQRIIELAARYRLPAIYPFSHMARSGGLIAYGIDQIEQYRAAAVYVDRILRGAKPGELPVQQPDKYDLAINLRAAKELGLNPSAALRARANELVD